MADNFKPLLNNFIRTFIIVKGARADRPNEYHNCMMPGAVEQSLGDITREKDR